MPFWAMRATTHEVSLNKHRVKLKLNRGEGHQRCCHHQSDHSGSSARWPQFSPVSPGGFNVGINNMHQLLSASGGDRPGHVCHMRGLELHGDRRGPDVPRSQVEKGSPRLVRIWPCLRRIKEARKQGSKDEEGEEYYNLDTIATPKGLHDWQSCVFKTRVKLIAI